MFTRILSILLLALALTGAPFGMGRMMDTAHAAAAMHVGHGAAHQDHSSQQTDHKSSAPHFVVCAACVAAVSQALVPVQIATLTGVLKSGFVPQLKGLRAVPDVPPPRT
jgi:hypothetical protein